MTGAPRAILITGASSGIGAALARHYAKPGILLHLSGRNFERLEALAAECRAKGAAAVSKTIDVLDREAMRDWITAADEAGPLDLVIANAGISGGSGAGGSLRWLDGERKIFDINVTGVLNTVEPVLDRMARRGSGQIALMSSLAAFGGWAGAPAYSASKAAVRMYGEGLRGALAGRGVRVSVICPGFIDTPMTRVNRFSMPFMMDAERAAAVIAEGLSRDRARVAFPWPTYLLAGFLGLLPGWLSPEIARRLPGKPPENP